jgi:hypothetical protein
MAATRAVHETYQRSGFGAGMAHFIAIVSHKGPFTAEIAAQPAPDPAMFGLPATDDGSRTDPLLGQNIVTSTHYEPHFDALGSASTQIVLAAGQKSAGEMAEPWRLRRRRPARHQAGALPERPRRLPRRRVRPDRPPGRLRGQTPRGPGRQGISDPCRQIPPVWDDASTAGHVHCC